MKKIIHYKVPLRNGKIYKSISYEFALFKVSIVSLGFEKVDFRFSLRWGW